MKEYPIQPGAEPFYFEGSDIGVLVSHGFTGTTQSMFYLGHYLAEKGGFTVIGPRLKGHGTTPADMAESTAEDWVRSVEHAMEKLQTRCRKIFITGLSMGGTLALYMAAMYPEVFAGAAPINGAVFLKNPGLASLAYGLGLPETVPGVGSDIKQPGIVELAYPVVPVPAVRQIYALMGATQDLLPRIVCPMLVFQSRVDHVVHPSNAPFIFENVSSADKTLVWLEDSYHVATLDNDKELIAGELLKFIHRLAG
ncbi:esterase/lipase [Longilinea arvoryzae]|uniref:Esterase/lipase n=1 Tax=Longilinea arvoryzae TaxID=360412 RepID=A0A0S7B6H5_9CHLR|nr:alpha/beta fold hydrolase [Longilinea arvoryzae]GAP12510.1 esterase/lipase [Longilinea arvoryzae]